MAFIHEGKHLVLYSIDLHEALQVVAFTLVKQDRCVE